MEAAGLKTAPFHVYVPSFGEWGFVIGGLSEYKIPEAFPEGLRYVTPRTVHDMFYFAPDMSHVDTKIQRLDDQALVRYFDQEWSEYLIY